MKDIEEFEKEYKESEEERDDIKKAYIGEQHLRKHKSAIFRFSRYT